MSRPIFIILPRVHANEGRASGTTLRRSPSKHSLWRRITSDRALEAASSHLALVHVMHVSPASALSRRLWNFDALFAAVDANCNQGPAN
ncbi:hypothetical protein K440DRAFT_619797 [Wilcoxina mikolae CBS 423.85]|nr:hypothetical protein K440DRAFT_619797 [Wilcoxina mikolae CBS 423.85]